MSSKSSRSIVAVFVVTVLLLTVEASPDATGNDDRISELQTVPVLLLEEGSPFQIDCIVSNARNSIVSFVKAYKGQSYSITSDLLRLYANRNVSIVYDKPRQTYSLKINSVTRSDIGLYSCELLQLTENTAECTRLTTLSRIMLNVLCPPEITSISISANFVHEGSPVTMQCYATGYPEPIVIWKRADNEKINGAGVARYPNNFIKLVQVFKKDSGVYECIAENLIGVAANKSVKLTVFAKKRLTTDTYNNVIEDLHDADENE